jgi:hypothetical protein
MQDYRSYHKPRNGERYIYVGDDNKAKVKTIGYFRLLLKTSLYLNLFDTFVVLSFRRNLISIFALYRHSNMIVSDFLSIMNIFYALDTIAFYNETLNNETQNIKQKLTHQDPAAL